MSCLLHSMILHSTGFISVKPISIRAHVVGRTKIKNPCITSLITPIVTENEFPLFESVLSTMLTLFNSNSFASYAKSSFCLMQQ